MRELKTTKPPIWLVMAALIPCLGMIFLDQTILPVALPTIQREFSASSTALQWCVNSYLLLTAMFALAGGKIGDRIGARKTFFLGISLFAFASILCSLSTTVQFLIGARALQGFGAALMIPSQTALFAAAFPPQQRGRAMGINASISSLFMILGPLIGGYLTESFSWRYIFWLNLPVAIFGLFLGRLFLPALPGGKVPVDTKGLLYFALSAGSLIIFFMQGPVWGWLSLNTLVFMLFFVVFLLLVLWQEKKADHPFLDLSLFKHPVFSAINISIGVLQFILMITVFRAIYFQTILGYTPFETGVITFASTLPVLFLSPIGGYLSDRAGPKVPLTIGYLFIIYSFFWLAIFSTPPLVSLLVACIAFGIGTPLVFTPSYSAAMKSVPPSKMGAAFGIVATLRNLAATMGVALIGLFIDTVQKNHLAEGQRAAYIAGFSAIHFALCGLVILAGSIALILHHRKSAHHLPESPAEGWD